MKGKFISAPAALFVLFLFFLPWVTISCNGFLIGEFSGYELAVGGETAAAGRTGLIGAEAFGGQPLLFLIPLAAVIVLGLILLGVLIKNLEKMSAWGQGIAGLFAILVLVILWIQLNTADDIVFDIVVNPGLWGTILMLAFIVLGAGFDIVRLHQPAPQPVSHPPPIQSAPYPPIPQAKPQPPPQRRTPSDAKTVTDAPPDLQQPYRSAGVSTRPDTPPSQPAQQQQPTLDEKSPALKKTILEPVNDPAQPAKTEVLSPQTELRAWLINLSDESTGQRYRLRDGMVIGRDPGCDIVLLDTAVSSRHARITQTADSFVLTDLKSTNGTRVYDVQAGNWQKISQTTLREGTKIKMGRIELQAQVQTMIN